jgi:hypothetical protein
MTPLEWIVVFAGAAAILAVNWWFFGTRYSRG